jgi:mono/diheme cytochrome c family protein
VDEKPLPWPESNQMLHRTIAHQPTAYRRPAAVLAAIVMLLSSLDPLRADEAAARGAQLVEQWCSMCHLEPSDRPDPDMAPPFEEIVNREGHDEAWLSRFMKEDHFPMTTFRLFDHEKADVISYLLSLQRQDD